MDLRPFVTWIIDDYEPSVRVSPRAGHYTRQPGVADIDLYGVSDMACTLFTIGRLRPSEAERRDWADAFATFQQDDGRFVEAQLTHDPMHSSAFAIAAMELVGLEPLRPLAFAEAHRTPERWYLGAHSLTAATRRPGRGAALPRRRRAGDRPAPAPRPRPPPVHLVRRHSTSRTSAAALSASLAAGTPA